MKPRLFAIAVAAALSAVARAIPDEHHDHESSVHETTTSSLSDEHEHRHGHHSHAPLLMINETEILEHHVPDSLSYYLYDLGLSESPLTPGVFLHGDDDKDDTPRRHPSLMLIHAASMILAFFGILPIGIVLRASSHRAHIFVQISFLALVFVGWSTSTLYHALTPDLYPGQKHSSIGYFVLAIVITIAASDMFGILSRFVMRQKGQFPLFFRQTTYPHVGDYATAAEDEDRDEEHHILMSMQLPMTKGPDTYYTNTARSPPSPHDDNDDDDDSGRFSGMPHNNNANEFDEVDLLANSPSSPHGNNEEGRPGIHGTMSHSVRMDYNRHSYNSASEHSTSLTLRDGSVSPSSFGSATGSASHHHHPSSYKEGYEEEIKEGEDLARKPFSNHHSSRGDIVVYLAEWALVILGYIELVTGGVTYTGICKRGYFNGCLAHTIKGSIFFLYGVATFCRYLGAFAQYGWAWNMAPILRNANGTTSRPRPRPRPRAPPSAEMIECSVIFFYGITNTWLERTGARPGAPYSTREIQHISIAVMFWFAGLVGMALESRRMRALLVWAGRPIRASSGSSISRRTNNRRSSAEAEEQQQQQLPSSSSAAAVSFNPFPALVIGTTGVAMAAHDQTYAYAVQVHMLWGGLLGLFAVMRCVIYLMLWVRMQQQQDQDQESNNGNDGNTMLQEREMPSRPPSEALASFFLACGGLVFIASTEQVEFAAMRNKHDDIMMLLNVVVALTCFVFSWCVLTLGLKGWARKSVAEAAVAASAAAVSSSATAV